MATPENLMLGGLAAGAGVGLLASGTPQGQEFNEVMMLASQIRAKNPSLLPDQAMEMAKQMVAQRQ